MTIRITDFGALTVFLLLCILSLPVRADAASVLLFRSASITPPVNMTLGQWVDTIHPPASPAPITMLDPAPGALVPADAASPIIRWQDDSAVMWFLELSVGGRPVCQGVIQSRSWIPSDTAWERIRQTAGTRPIHVAVVGLDTNDTAVSHGTTRFSISRDPVGAHIGFIRKRLPFRKAKDTPKDGQMLVGDLSSFGEPRVVMTGQPICFNCHAYSPDGKAYGMDMDYKGDKGGYALVGMTDQIAVSDEDVISWNDYDAPEPSKYSMGLFTTFSPDGRYAASTVGESSAFVMLDDLHFSQMFYPATGQIALYDRTTGTVAPLPGADDIALIQTNPAFTADGSRVAFARAYVKPATLKAIEQGVMRNEDPKQSILDVNEKYPMQFNLYSVPFNGGKGGAPEPVAGASGNGKSNFFPKYSPDGKWLVFTQCDTGLVLQPDSRLVIIPAEGGEPRVLTANTPLMNSWHSWSPNSRWLAFASKGNSPYTEIYLTHIDESGASSPALRLFRFSSHEMAAMVPEFLPSNSPVLQRMALANPDGAVAQSQATDGR